MVFSPKCQTFKMCCHVLLNCTVPIQINKNLSPATVLSCFEEQIKKSTNCLTSPRLGKSTL